MESPGEHKANVMGEMQNTHTHLIAAEECVTSFINVLLYKLLLLHAFAFIVQRKEIKGDLISTK